MNLITALTCRFPGTSFAWEKHLALRNTPYSTVRHSRVFRGSESGERKLDDTRNERRLEGDHDFSERLFTGSKGTPTKLTESLRSGESEIWPSPKGI